jgi:hypothetical protein
VVDNDKALLAIDESIATCNKRFEKWGFLKLKKCAVAKTMPRWKGHEHDNKYAQRTQPEA